jgi:hypothetical protein
MYVGAFYIQKPVKYTMQLLDCSLLIETCSSEETKIVLCFDEKLNLNCGQCLLQVFHALEKQGGKLIPTPLLFLVFETPVLSEYNLICKKLCPVRFFGHTQATFGTL